MKLLRKDVLKWIRVLKSGAYRKGRGKLVSNGGKKFCCLGVWADMHGATWDENISFNGTGVCLVPVQKGKLDPVEVQKGVGLYVRDPALARGLNDTIQNQLANINDTSRGFGKVIEYIKENVLPLAK